MEKRELIYEGKAKKLYTTDDPDLLIQYFKDDATAFNAKKRGTIEDKGVLNNRMSEIFFGLVEGEGVHTHFVERLSDREMLVKRLDIVPVETVVRNIVAGSLAKRMGLEEGGDLPHPIVEYYYKSDPLDDPMINEDHIDVFKLATRGRDGDDPDDGAESERGAASLSRRTRHLARRCEVRVRQTQGRDPARRRDLPRHVPILGQANAARSWTRTDSDVIWGTSREPIGR